jgi:hypothetical protein
MVKSRMSKTNRRKISPQSKPKANRLKLAEAKLAKKKKELLEIKALHRKVAGEFIDLWMETRRLKRMR